MKLNSTTQMMPCSYPEFTEIHPFAPEEQALGENSGSHVENFLILQPSLYLYL